MFTVLPDLCVLAANLPTSSQVEFVTNVPKTVAHAQQLAPVRIVITDTTFNPICASLVPLLVSVVHLPVYVLRVQLDITRPAQTV